jgi:hypothetical protein
VKTPSCGLAWVAVAGLLALGGCQAPPKPGKFNNDMARASQKLSNAAKEFRKKLEPLSQGKPVSASDVRSAYQAAASALASVRKDYDDPLVPGRSKAAPALLEKYKAFLSGQQKILDGPYKEILAIAEGPGDPVTKWKQLEPLFQQAWDEETKWSGELNKVQQDYAKEHNLEPK